jgi:hypothetical protein
LPMQYLPPPPSHRHHAIYSFDLQNRPCASQKKRTTKNVPRSRPSFFTLSSLSTTLGSTNPSCNRPRPSVSSLVCPTPLTTITPPIDVIRFCFSFRCITASFLSGIHTPFHGLCSISPPSQHLHPHFLTFVRSYLRECPFLFGFG